MLRFAKITGVSCGLTALLAGCAVTNAPSAPPTVGPAIVTQPQDASVPMGLSGNFTVKASGTGLAYQWFENGKAIAGATASSYATPNVAASDAGEGFSVQVSNAGGSVTSRVATLSVTARAPLAGDLRFAGVDSADLVNGYTEGGFFAPTVFIPPPGGQAGAESGNSASGPFRLSNCECGWQYEAFGPHSQLLSVYTGADIANLSAIFGRSSGSEFPAVNDPQSVLTTAGVAYDLPTFVAFGYVHGTDSRAFTRSQSTVSMAAFPAAAAQEGAQGRVITALFVVGSNVTYFSYAWAGDPNGVYETQVMNGTLSQTMDMAKALATQGYIITANTSTQAADGSGVTLVGTRVKGDTMARPFLEEDQGDDQLRSGGYARTVWTWDMNASGLSGYHFFGER